LLIERDWYRLGRCGLDGHGRCAACGTRLPGHFGHFGGDFNSAETATGKKVETNEELANG
jgi:hypothetical protein